MSEQILVGVDEAGRGPLAGRVYAASVILDKNHKILGLNDSKKLSTSSRSILYEKIKKESLAFGVGYAEVCEIEKLNILNATFLAMKRSIANLNYKFNYIVVDGNIYPFKGEYPGEAIIKGDSKVEEIMAASIMAKVERDMYMEEIAKIYPNYLFEKHKGYPTKLHKEMINKYGILPIHRKSFIH